MNIHFVATPGFPDAATRYQFSKSRINSDMASNILSIFIILSELKRLGLLSVFCFFIAGFEGRRIKSDRSLEPHNAEPAFRFAQVPAVAAFSPSLPLGITQDSDDHGDGEFTPQSLSVNRSRFHRSPSGGT